MSWGSLTLVTDAEIGYLEPEAVATSAPWGATTWANQRAQAKNTLQAWIEKTHPDVVGVADLVRDERPPAYAFGYTSAAYTDKTSECANPTESDVLIGAILATPASDRIYIGASSTFDGLSVRVSSANANASVLTAKYWNGTAWTSLSATDGTASSGKAFGQAGRVTWTMPTAWDPRSLNGTSEYFYWVELSVSAALTAGTAASQIVPVMAPLALKSVCAQLALYYILNGLAEQSANPPVWREKAQYYWNRAESEFGEMRDKLGLPIDLNRSGTVTVDETAQARTTGRVTLGRA